VFGAEAVVWAARLRGPLLAGLVTDPSVAARLPDQRPVIAIFVAVGCVVPAGSTTMRASSSDSAAGRDRQRILLVTSARWRRRFSPSRAGPAGCGRADWSSS